MAVGGADDRSAAETERLGALRRYGLFDTPPEPVLTRVCELAVQVFGVPMAAVSVVDADRVWFAAGHGLPVPEMAREDTMCDSAVVYPDDLFVITDTSTDLRTQGHPMTAGEWGVRAYAAAPIVTPDGHRLGAVSILDRRPRAFAPDQLAVLATLAATVTETLQERLKGLGAVARAEVGRDRYELLADTLQRSLSPPRLPDIPWLQVAACHHPATAELGGDFYDLFELADGTIATFVGDVCGKGARAASLTSLVRYSLRGAAICEHDPGAVLHHLNAAVMLEHEARGAEPGTDGDDGFLLSTVVYGRVFRPDEEGQVEARLTTGGHPPPLLARSDGSVEVVPCQGPLVGFLDRPRFDSVQVLLKPGDTLLLYTDGVTDVRTAEGRFGIEGLTRFLPAGDTSAGGVIDRLNKLVAGFGSHRRDDIAALALTNVT